ncbi:MAG: hypothetical protein ABI039_13700 [Vicinamibacterales bacterium]
MITGLFMDRDSAERGFLAVTGRGYDKGDINIVMDDDTRKRYFPADPENRTGLGDKAAEADALGGPKGGTLVTLVTAFAAVGTFLLLPGLGVVLAGPVAAAVAGAGAAAVAGGLIGALHDWGIPKERLEEYEAGIKKSGILMGVKPRNDEDARYFEAQWKAAGAQHVYS